MNGLLWGGALSCWTKAGRSCPLFRWEKEQNQSQQPALSCPLSLWESNCVQSQAFLTPHTVCG